VLRTTVLSAALALALGVSALPAWATVAEEAQQLMQQGELAGALDRLDGHLRRNPQDAEARFTRGLVLARMDRLPEAVRAFADLARDYPQLPEPYNNLAVLYAQQGEFEKARDALEAALATHPSYATAHENLGDIYAALAGAAYNRALMLDQSNRGVQQKLSLINQLDGATVIAAAPAKVPVATPVAPAAETPAPAVPADVPAPAVPEATAAATPEPTPAPAEPEARPPAAAPAVETGPIRSTVMAWARAWAAQDVDAYLDVYADSFQPEDGLSRAEWEAQRRDRVAGPGTITVEVRDLTLETAGAGADARASATFTQAYSSDNYRDEVRKTLDLVIEQGRWKIVREYSR